MMSKSVGNVEKETIPNWFLPYKIPAEISGSIPPLVFLAGLDIETNQVHRGIYELISHKPTTKDFQPACVVVPLKHEYPVKKPRMEKENMTTYIPHGILKTNWLQKHMQLIPSVVVAFFNMNWKDKHWKEKKKECADNIKELKAELLHHGSQLLVVLVKTADAGDDNFSTDRASSLCAAAEIPHKSLYILAHTSIDRIQACVQRLEVGMREASKTYYLGRIRRVRNMRDKTSDLALHARYHFKTAFFQEIRRDYVSALDNYECVFSNVITIDSTETIIQQVRCVIGWITYRQCRLNLLKMDFKEAERLFQKRMDSFHKHKENPQLKFEEYAWFQQQYTAFAELVRQFFRPGVTLLDPVTYFLLAVKYAQKRHELAKEVKEVHGEFQYPAKLEEFRGNCDVKYVGQRPWCSDVYFQNFGGEYMLEDKHSIDALNYFEQLYDHSADKINSLGVASDFCRDKQRLRTRCQLMMMMGFEFFSMREYHRAVMLMAHVLREFGRDKGSSLLYLVANCGLMAACSNGDVAGYLSFLVFLLKKDFQEFVSSDRRHELWSKLQMVMNKKVPPVEKNCILDKEKWNASLASPYTSCVGVHRESILEARFYFASDVLHVATPAEICIELRNSSEFPISLIKCGAGISSAEYSCETALDLTLQPRDSHNLSLFFTPLNKDIGRIIQVNVGFVDIGKPNASILLHYGPALGTNPVQLWREGKKDKREQIIAKIDPMLPLLNSKIVRTEPMLTNEWHKILVTWTNNDTVAYLKLELSFLLPGSDPTDVVACSKPPDTTKYGGLGHYVYLERLEPSDSIETSVYVKCVNIARKEVQFQVKVKYSAEGDDYRQNLVNEVNELLEVVQPLEIRQTVHNLQCDRAGFVMKYEDFLVNFTIKNICRIPIEILNTSVLKSHGKARRGPGTFQYYTGHEGVIMEPGEKIEIAENFIQQVRTISPIGDVAVLWRRADSNVPGCVTCEPVHPVLLAAEAQIYVEGILNAKGKAVLKNPFQARYDILNRSDKVYDIWVSLDASECFMNAGPKKVKKKLLGYDLIQMNYALFPLKTGLLKTPRLNIEICPLEAALSGGGDIPNVVHKNVVKFIHVTGGESPEPEAES